MRSAILLVGLPRRWTPSFFSIKNHFMHIDRLKGLVNAPEFPKGLAWFNTDYPLLLNDFKGKIVLLDFWTYCCINCHHVLPDLKRLESEYPNELVVIGVHSAKFSSEKDSDNIREAVLRHKIQHPVVNDYEMTVWRNFAIRSWPSFVLLNPAGRIVGQSSGEGIYAKIQPIIEQLIDVFGADDMISRKAIPFTLEESKEAKTLLSFPSKIEVNKANKHLYIVDSNNNRIIVATEKGEILSCIGSGDSGLKDGSFSEAQFNQPQGLSYHNNCLYVADTENHAIRVVDFESGQVSTLIGTGEQAKKFNVEGNFSDISLNSPWDIEADKDRLFVAMAGPHQIWELNLTTQFAKVWAGTGGETLRDGPRKEALLAQPSGLCFYGKELIFADSEVSAIRSVGITEDAAVQTYVGEGLFDYGDIDGISNDVRLQHPLAVATWRDQIVVADTYNNKIKLLNPLTNEVKTLIGTGESGTKDGLFTEATLNEPAGLAVVGNILFIADTNNHLIRIADLSSKQLSTLMFTNTSLLQSLDSKSEKSAESSFTHKTSLISIFPKNNELKVAISLPENMKLNELADSVAILTDGKKTVRVSLNGLDGKIPLDLFKTTDAEELKLSGYLYYCEKNPENMGQCFVHEFEQNVHLSDNNTPAAVELITVNVPDYDANDLF